MLKVLRSKFLLMNFSFFPFSLTSVLISVSRLWTFSDIASPINSTTLDIQRVRLLSIGIYVCFFYFLFWQTSYFEFKFIIRCLNTFMRMLIFSFFFFIPENGRNSSWNYLKNHCQEPYPQISNHQPKHLKDSKKK